ncbi:MAG: DUF503 domain-containing protein [Deltaproteobacteria bacterium]|nr:DUF503 domain-containing protein [Deltaproteobacteria bacterium]MBZ0218822.1 DUF503 domain-containing protein [Deltaproteobacteria bacterium]
MVIGVSRVTLIVHESRSLKDKRQAIKSVIGKVKNRFNVSIAEVADNDSWQKATIGIAAVGNDKAFVNSVLDKTLSFIEGLHLAEVTDSTIEMINI